MRKAYTTAFATFAGLVVVTAPRICLLRDEVKDTKQGAVVRERTLVAAEVPRHHDALHALAQGPKSATSCAAATVATPCCRPRSQPPLHTPAGAGATAPRGRMRRHCHCAARLAALSGGVRGLGGGEAAVPAPPAPKAALQGKEALTRAACGGGLLAVR